MDYIKIYEEEHIKNGLSYPQIQAKYGIPRGTWDYHIRHKAGLRCDLRKYRANDRFFQTIDSEIKAYLLGFFTADGAINKDGRISFNLHHQDRYVLELFQEYVCPTKEITENDYAPHERSKQVNFRFKSLPMVKDLERLGLFHRKTYTEIETLKFIPDELKCHFIRGFLDGDGYIARKRYAVVFCTTSKVLLQDIKDFIESKITGELQLERRKGITTDYYKLATWRKLESMEICNLLYADYEFALPRKEQIALVRAGQYRANFKD